MSRSSVVGYLTHNALEISHAETTTSASQLHANLQESPIEQFPENHDIVEYSAYLVADRAHDFPEDFSPNADDEADMIPKFARGLSSAHG
jgi:hypothetical protein